MQALLRGMKLHFNDEASAGCPCDSELDIQYHSSKDAFAQLLDLEELVWSNDLVEDVSNAFSNQGWVDAPDGDWAGVHMHERLFWSWDAFSNTVKHRSRFHFHRNRRQSSWSDEPISAHEMLPFLGILVRKNRLIKKIPVSQVFYRSRKGQHAQTTCELGPPPSEIASAGRMNPAGISYMYLAYQNETAIAEIRPNLGDTVTTSLWRTKRELNVLDLTQFPSCPSIFSDKRRERDLIQFLYSFVDEIKQPIKHNGSEHIEYVPTQVVSEYFAQVFRFNGGSRLDGIVYASSVHEGGKNLVLFPDYEATGFKFRKMELTDAQVITV
jgi:RES domain-containing protein